MIAVLKTSPRTFALWAWHRGRSTGIRPAVIRMRPGKGVSARRRRQLAGDLIHSKPQLTTLRLVSFLGQTDTLTLAPNCKFLFPAEAPLKFAEYILGPKLKSPLRHRDRVTIHGPVFTFKGVEHLRSLPFLPNAYAVEARIFKRGASLSPRNDLGNESRDPVCL